MRKSLLTALASLAASLIASLLVALPALAYPDRPITLIAPFTPGGDADLSARNLAPAAQRILGQPIVVLNKAGASGALGSQQVKDATPDGYTLLVARVASHAVLPALKKNLSYKWNDFTFIGLLELNPVVCVVHADSPFHTLDDLKHAITTQPRKLNYSSSGIGTILHLGTQLLLQAFGAPSDAAAHVPYKGGGEAALAVLAKEVDFSCLNFPSAVGLIQSKRLRALAVLTPTRLKDIPDVPTAREAGYPQLEAIVGWSALLGPPRMDPAALATWIETLRTVGKDAGWRAAEEKIGSIPRMLSPQETERFMGEQYDIYARLAAQLHLEVK
jgi:tripartite-type tricarboxylate transporter receptor subunit TctC